MRGQSGSSENPDDIMLYVGSQEHLNGLHKDKKKRKKKIKIFMKRKSGEKVPLDFPQEEHLEIDNKTEPQYTNYIRESTHNWTRGSQDGWTKGSQDGWTRGSQDAWTRGSQAYDSAIGQEHITNCRMPVRKKLVTEGSHTWKHGVKVTNDMDSYHGYRPTWHVRVRTIPKSRFPALTSPHNHVDQPLVLDSSRMRLEDSRMRLEDSKSQSRDRELSRIRLDEGLLDRDGEPSRIRRDNTHIWEREPSRLKRENSQMPKSDRDPYSARFDDISNQTREKKIYNFWTHHLSEKPLTENNGPSAPNKKYLIVKMPDIDFDPASPGPDTHISPSPQPVGRKPKASLTKTFVQNKLRQKEVKNLLEDVKELTDITLDMKEKLDG